jgi:hypothetical protein
MSSLFDSGKKLASLKELKNQYKLKKMTQHLQEMQESIAEFKLALKTHVQLLDQKKIRKLELVEKQALSFEEKQEQAQLEIDIDYLENELAENQYYEKLYQLEEETEKYKEYLEKIKNK